MTRHGRKTENERKKEADVHSASFVALVELVRHMARYAAQHDYESMQRAVKDNEKLISEWKNKQ